jgi:hypothetical protein
MNLCGESNSAFQLRCNLIRLVDPRQQGAKLALQHQEVDFLLLKSYCQGLPPDTLLPCRLSLQVLRLLLLEFKFHLYTLIVLFVDLKFRILLLKLVFEVLGYFRQLLFVLSL